MGAEIGGKNLVELSSTEGLAKGPSSWGNIVGHHTVAITCGDLKREGLSIKIGVALPILPPVP